MASSGTARYPGTDQFPNTNVFPGQGTRPMPWILYSTSDVTTDPPVWTDATAAAREWTTQRGRSSELDEVDAGTATIVVDNATRTFDPIINSNIRPMNRWWIRTYNPGGEVQDIFKGYAESYKQAWLSKRNTEAHTIVSCADEFKLLALGRLPVTSPPRDTYADVVLFDAPSGYWQFPERDALTPTVGPALTLDTGFTSAGSLVGGSAIVGEEIGGWLGPLGSGDGVFLPAFDDNEGQPGNACGLAEFTVEFWFMTGDATPAANRQLIVGQNVSALRNWRFLLNTGGTVLFEAREDTGPTLRQVTTTSTLNADTWYHIVGTIDGGSIRIYLNGTQEASTGFTGVVDQPHDAGERMSIVGEAENFEYDEVAFYPTGLSATRIAAHYTAGTARGFSGGQVAGTRAGAILDAVTSHAPRRIDAGERQMPGRFMRGQPTVDELRDTARAEAPDGVLFVSRAGEIVLLDNDHRASSPYNTVQATFDDDGTDFPYQEFDPDFSEAFLFNEFNLTGVGFGGAIADASQLDTSSDATSQARYGSRPAPPRQLPIIVAADLTSIGDDLLAKYKDPLQRIQLIGFKTATPDVTEAIFKRDIGDRIRVFRRPVGGGSAYDQTLFIQSVRVSASAKDAGLWSVTWGVSPV